MGQIQGLTLFPLAVFADNTQHAAKDQGWNSPRRHDSRLRCYRLSACSSPCRAAAGLSSQRHLTEAEHRDLPSRFMVPAALAPLFSAPTKQSICPLHPRGCRPWSEPHHHLLAWDAATASKWSPFLQSHPFRSILYME